MQKVEDFMENLTKHDAEIWNNAISEFIEKFIQKSFEWCKCI